MPTHSTLFSVMHRVCAVLMREGWLEDIAKNGPNDVKTILIGNKSDLKAQRQVDYLEARCACVVSCDVVLNVS